MKQIALLGVGTMGAGMAENWLKKGFSLAAYNRTRAKAAALVELGARRSRIRRAKRRWAPNSSLPSSPTSGPRATSGSGENGALAGAGPGTILVELSTVPPAWVGELARLAGERGCEFLDVPVGGSKAVAASGGLTLFAGGDAATLERARPALEAVGRQIVHLGPTGAGATWKLIHNMMLAVHVAAAAEAIALAEQAGFDPAQTASLIANGPPGAASCSSRCRGSRSGALMLPISPSGTCSRIPATRWLSASASACASIWSGLPPASMSEPMRWVIGDLDFAGVFKAVAD